MMYSNGHGCGSGYVWGDGGIGIGYESGRTYESGNGYGDGYEYGIGIEGDGRGNEFMEIEEEEQLSAIRLLSDATQDINFYICQLQLIKKQNEI